MKPLKKTMYKPGGFRPEACISRYVEVGGPYVEVGGPCKIKWLIAGYLGLLAKYLKGYYGYLCSY
jgi:hypothetical protein